ncbi:type II toxin-antitoxin system antitoxin SocA domain-containing protein [Streptococcus mutans]|uniref:type II toxin-antitoxin system antitoxin SocA domain-containing protein n=1 Tax=Streptococcus mutans TaxID=1309 RepID=UPI0002B55540|nr:type II toxin-antitoxin system antitoxin SocA domain-containing protein [Streptococcus mutans]EMB62836.1 prophage ps3 protein 01, putative [Streptococcus mutans 1SM1]
MAEKRVFCEHCLNDITYHIEDRELTRKLKGKDYTFKGQEAICDNCKKPVFVAEIDNVNRQALYACFKWENDIISVSEIEAILEKYNIGAKPLSKLLGWGINTIPRYLKGDISKPNYSVKLRRIAAEPDYFLSFLKSRSNILKPVAYEKSLKATENLLKNGEADNKVLTANYLLSKNDEITPLALQKLLYYVQGFSYAFTGKFMFQSDCESWVHGPVYRDIYFKYQKFGWEPIVFEKDYDYETFFTSQEIQLLDSIVKNLSVYSGKVLEKFTHEESPWLSARGELKEDEPSANIIAKDRIADFFCKIKDKYNMLTVDDISDYTKARFDNLSF